MFSWYEFLASTKVKFSVVWNTHKIQSLFPLKDKVQHLSCVIYKGICLCGNIELETLNTSLVGMNLPEQLKVPSKGFDICIDNHSM